MKTGQDYMRKASSILSKPPESESNDDIIQPTVCSLLLFLYYAFLFYFVHNFSPKRIKNSVYVKLC